MTQESKQVKCAALVDSYYTIQETRKRLDLREQALCRDEIILATGDEEDRKVIGHIVDETETAYTINTATGEKTDVKKEREVPKADIRKVIRAKFKTVEEAQEALYRWPTGKRIADVSSPVFLRMEEDIKKELAGVLEEWPVWTGWLKEVKGVGPISACGMWAHIDIRIADSPSKLWHYAGHHVDEEGRLPHLEKGVKRSWNRRLQTIVWNCGESIVRTHGGYRELYDQFKQDELSHAKTTVKPEAEELAGMILAEEIGKYKTGSRIKDKAHGARILKELGALRPILCERTPGHIDRRARRRMRKVLLAHLWLQWRRMEGLPVRPVYIVAKDGQHAEIPVIMK